MAGYGWTTYDARHGGTQHINDTRNQLDLFAQYAKFSDHSWGLRIRGFPRSDRQDGQMTTIIFYIGNEDSDSNILCHRGRSTQPRKLNVVCNGKSAGLDEFELQVLPSEEYGNPILRSSVKSLNVGPERIWQAKSIFLDQLKSEDNQDNLLADDPGEGDLHFIQQSFRGGFEFDVLFFPKSHAADIDPRALTDSIQRWLLASASVFSRYMPLNRPSMMSNMPNSPSLSSPTSWEV